MIPEVEKLVSDGKLSQADGEKLSLLQPGVFCQHKSWGAGRVKDWDLLGDRMTIDFEEKPGHTMKLSFAAGSLEVLPTDHLLARRVGDLAGLQELAKEKPAQLVELALKCSGGKLSLDALEALLKGRIIPDASYKSWWNLTKRALKDNRHIVVPTKRTESLTLRDSGQSHAETMVSAFIAARDLKAKLNALAMVQKDLDLFANAASELLPVFDEVSITVRKAWRMHPKESLQLLLSRDELLDLVSDGKLPHGSLTVEEHLREARPQIAQAASGLTTILITRMYRAFPAAFPEREWVQECLNHLTKTGGRALEQIAAVLDANDELDVLADYLKRAVRNRLLSTDLLIWMCKERKGLAESVFDLELGNAILSALEDDHMRGGPKKTARLHDAFVDDLGLVPEMISDASSDELVIFAKRILNTPVFDELTRRSLMGRIIKTRPETQTLMSEGASTKEAALVVSWESMERRKQELEEITREKIPQNKKDIQIAREYGDLRENAEYKSAREQQAVLLRQQSKYERELRLAQGTDFADAPTDQVGIGTVVDCENVKSGAKETHTILGAWDGDPDKHILSYLSEMAKALIGKKVGEETDLPSEEGHEVHRVRINAIRGYKQ
jgi:transcription elongation GreA/GreB family factor